LSKWQKVGREVYMRIHAVIEELDYPIVKLKTEFGDKAIDYSNLSENSTTWKQLEFAFLEQNIVFLNTENYNVETYSPEMFTLEQLNDEPIEVKTLSELNDLINNLEDGQMIELDSDTFKGVFYNGK
jgi:hypothetical protein